ncbi:MAG: hypothetical protein GTO03_16160 [Planctomycetales bacterium]|nr:hypothetical protein [Planctomycetales bacterium]
MQSLASGRPQVLWLTITWAWVLGTAASLLAAPPQPPAASSYAPIADLAPQMDFYVEALEKALEGSDDEYGELAQRTVRKSADMLAVLALVIGNHDQDHPRKATAGKLLAAAEELAEAAAQQEAAQVALQQLKQVLAGEAAGGDGDEASLEWRRVADMENLMKQVQFLNSRLKRSVKGTKLKSQADKTTAYAATLAAVAQGIVADTSDVENDADLEKWYQFCAEMRDAAGQVNQAIHAQDADRVQASMEQLKASCDACHAVFEEEQL